MFILERKRSRLEENLSNFLWPWFLVTHRVMYIFLLLTLISITNFPLTLFRMGNFGAAHKWEGGGKKAPLPKICHTYPTWMKLGTVIPYISYKKIQKNIWITWNIAWVLLTWAIFTRNQQILLYQKMQI